MLQEADPEGNGHIRMPGGIPIYADNVPGYYDGTYTYIDENKKYVTSGQGYKIDIICKTKEDYVWDELEYDSFKDKDIELVWNKLKEKFRFEAMYNPVSDAERIDSFWKSLRKDFDEFIKFEKENDQKYLKETIDNFKKGYRFLQDKKITSYYSFSIIDENGKTRGCSYSTSHPILNSGMFEPMDKGEFIEWILKK